jgi:hypothetical protein
VTAGLLSAAPAPAAPAAGGARSTVLSSARVADSKAGSLESHVRGEFGRHGTVRGDFKPVRWIHRAGGTYAVGMLHATLRRGDGHVLGTVDRRVVLPLRHGSVGKAAACDILNLVLGPLDLNLLGLHVTLNRVLLHIEAIPGAGNLLGNLLCAVAGLLDQTGLLGQLRLTNLLNRILNLVG